jgi:small nuclear ribonucleoprotein (snRNP)-like protein
MHGLGGVGGWLAVSGDPADFSNEYVGYKVRVETSIGVVVEGVLVEASRYWFKVKGDKGVVYINKTHVVMVTPLGGSRGGGGCRGLSTGSQL